MTQHIILYIRVVICAFFVLSSCLLNTNTQAQEGCDLLCQLGITNPAVPSKDKGPKENKPQIISPRSQNTEVFSSINRGNLFSEKDLYALIDFLINTLTEGEESLDELQENLKFSFGNFKVQRDVILISNFRVLGRDRFSDPWVNIVHIPSINCNGYRISDKSIYLAYVTPPYQTIKKLYDNFSCRISNMRFEFIDDPILFYEFVNEFFYEIRENTVAVELLRDFLSNISMGIYSNAVKANNNEITLKTSFTEKNAFEMSMQLEGIVDADFHAFTEKINNAIIEDELGFDSPQEYKSYLNDLTTDEYLNDLLYLSAIDTSGYYTDAYYNYGLPPINIRNFSFKIKWSKTLLALITDLSEGGVDQALEVLRLFTSEKMSKYELTLLMVDSLGKEMAASILAYFYPFYSEALDELKKFSQNPRGLGLSISNKSIDIDDIIDSIDSPTPIELFILLSSLELDITANPVIRK